MGGRQLAPNRVELTSAHGRTVVELDGRTLKWAEQRWVPDNLLKVLEHSRNLERQAPRGDRHGAWQKVGEIPLSLVWDKLRRHEDPADERAFDRACARVLNDSDYRAFRADGSHRKL